MDSKCRARSSAVGGGVCGLGQSIVTTSYGAQDVPTLIALATGTEVHQVCESQADGVYASCWFMPGSAEQEKRMWDKYGGGLSGGVRIDSTVERLISSLPEEDFGLGMIRYIRPDISFSEAFDLNQYRSMPFLLKLSDNEDDREIRLFTRYRGLLSGKSFVPVPNRHERRGIRVLINGERL